MAREILLRFGTTNLQKAREASKQVLKTIREAARGIQDVQRRKEVLGEIQSESLEQRAALNRERDRQRGDRRSLRARRKARAFQGPQGVPRFGDPDESLIQATEGQGAFKSLDLASRSLIAIPILGDILAPVLEEIVRPFLRAEFEALERARLDPIIARLEALEAESLTRRLQEDADLQERLAGEASAQNAVIQNLLRQGRFTKSSRISRLGLGG